MNIRSLDLNIEFHKTIK